MSRARPSHTPALTNTQLEDYLRSHLGNELHWLLRAATEWRVQKRLSLKISGYHMQVFAMDSTFLHARTLFEFFTKRTSDNYYGYNQFGINMIPPGATQVPTRYLTNNWGNALHAYLMHAQDRTVSRRLVGFNGTVTKDLKNMPVDFAQEIVKLWRNFSMQLGASANPDISRLEPIANDILQQAIDQTEDVYTRKKVTLMKRKYKLKAIVW